MILAPGDVGDRRRRYVEVLLISVEMVRKGNWRANHRVHTGAISRQPSRPSPRRLARRASLDDLAKALETRIQSDQQKRNLTRNFSILIDYRWMTEEIGEEDLDTRIALSEKYCVELVEIHRLLHQMLR
jgi:hypothetical protein